MNYKFIEYKNLKMKNFIVGIPVDEFMLNKKDIIELFATFSGKVRYVR